MRSQLTLAFVFFLSMSAAAAFPYSQDTAQKILVSSVVQPSSLPDNAVVRLYVDPLPAGTEVIDGYFESFSLNQPAYLGWIDPTPDLAFAHQTFYAIMYENSMQLLAGQGWPIVNGEDARVSKKAVAVQNKDVAGFQIPFSDAPVLANKVVARLNWVYQLPPTPPSEVVLTDKECPPGYVKKQAKQDEHGVAFTALAPIDPNIDFEAEANRFTSAVHAAKFEDWGSVSTPQALQRMLADLSQKLEPGSTLAMYISSHGQQLFDVTLKHVKTGDELVLQDYPGEPSAATQANPARYADCFEADNSIKQVIPCGELLTHSVAIPDGYYVVSVKRSGWCFLLENKCVKFSPDVHLKSMLSCRKFLATNACFSGAITSHTVKGLSAYASAQNNEPAWGVPGYQGGPKVESQYGELFTKKLQQKPPLDPIHPDLDEPKPEFDGAHQAAASVIIPGRQFSKTYVVVHQGRAVNWTGRTVVKQTPSEHAELGDENCAEKIMCVPAQIVPAENLKHISCKDMSNDYFDAKNDCNKKCFYPPCKRVNTQAGSCYACPSVNDTPHIIPPKLDSCGDLSFPPYYSNHERCDQECPTGKCRPFKDPASKEDCWECPSIREDLVPPPKIEPCPGLSSPPYYKLKQQCDQSCPSPPCRQTSLGGGCYECPSILEDLPKTDCAKKVNLYLSDVKNHVSFSIPGSFGSLGLELGVYALQGSAAGSFQLDSQGVQFSPTTLGSPDATARLLSMSILQTGLVNACPSYAAMLDVATGMIQIEYKPKTPVNIITNILPGLLLPTTHALTPLVQSPSFSTPLTMHGGLVTGLNPLHVVGGFTHGVVSYTVPSAVSWYPQQATQTSSYVSTGLHAVSFGMFGGLYG